MCINETGVDRGSIQVSSKLAPTYKPFTVHDEIFISEGPIARTICVAEHIPQDMERGPEWSIQDFDVHKALYRGKASHLYRAIDQVSGMVVALKLYRKKKLSVLNRYQVEREIRIHIRMRHENIVQLFAAFEDEKNVYLVQEFADGGDLYQHLKKLGGQLPEAVAVQEVIKPFLDAIMYIHEMGIIHRDIKPENILLTSTKQLKIADFGLSIDIALERPVTRAGTLDYMAPEVLACPDKRRPEDNKDKTLLAYTAQVDSWAVGILAYELQVGCPPFEHESRGSTYESIMYGHPSFPDWMSEEARKFIALALTKSAATRPTGAQLATHPWILRFTGSEVPAAEVPGTVNTEYRAKGAEVQRSDGRRPSLLTPTPPAGPSPVVANVSYSSATNSSGTRKLMHSSTHGDGLSSLASERSSFRRSSSRNLSTVFPKSGDIAATSNCTAQAEEVMEAAGVPPDPSTFRSSKGNTEAAVAPPPPPPQPIDRDNPVVGSIAAGLGFRRRARAKPPRPPPVSLDFRSELSLEAMGSPDSPELVQLPVCTSTLISQSQSQPIPIPNRLLQKSNSRSRLVASNTLLASSNSEVTGGPVGTGIGIYPSAPLYIKPAAGVLSNDNSIAPSPSFGPAHTGLHPWQAMVMSKSRNSTHASGGSMCNEHSFGEDLSLCSPFTDCNRETFSIITGPRALTPTTSSFLPIAQMLEVAKVQEGIGRKDPPSEHSTPKALRSKAFGVRSKASHFNPSLEDYTSHEHYSQHLSTAKSLVDMSIEDSHSTALSLVPRVPSTPSIKMPYAVPRQYNGSMLTDGSEVSPRGGEDVSVGRGKARGLGQCGNAAERNVSPLMPRKLTFAVAPAELTNTGRGWCQ